MGVKHAVVGDLTLCYKKIPKNKKEYSLTVTCVCDCSNFSLDGLEQASSYCCWGGRSEGLQMSAPASEANICDSHPGVPAVKRKARECASHLAHTFR